jgi:hypothetical protein
VGMLGDMFLWLVANVKQGVIYFIKQALPPNISAGSVAEFFWKMQRKTWYVFLFGGGRHTSFPQNLLLKPKTLITSTHRMLVHLVEESIQ